MRALSRNVTPGHQAWGKTQNISPVHIVGLLLEGKSRGEALLLCGFLRKLVSCISRSKHFWSWTSILFDLRKHTNTQTDGQTDKIKSRGTSKRLFPLSLISSKYCGIKSIMYQNTLTDSTNNMLSDVILRLAACVGSCPHRRPLSKIEKFHSPLLQLSQAVFEVSFHHWNCQTASTLVGCCIVGFSFPEIGIGWHCEFTVVWTKLCESWLFKWRNNKPWHWVSSASIHTSTKCHAKRTKLCTSSSLFSWKPFRSQLVKWNAEESEPSTQNQHSIWAISLQIGFDTLHFCVLMADNQESVRVSL